MLDFILMLAAGALTGALTGGLLAWWLVRRDRRQDETPATEPSDPWVAAEIDRAAVSWAMDNGRPEAAGVMADKLHLLHRLGQREQGGQR